MFNKKLALSIIMTASIFTVAQAFKKEPLLPKVKPYLPMIAKAINIAASNKKVEGLILGEVFDSSAAELAVDPRPLTKKLGEVCGNLAAIFKTPEKFTLEETAKVLEDFFVAIDAIDRKDNIVRFNDTKALEKAADILVNHNFSLVGQQINGDFMFLRIATQAMATVLDKTESASFKELHAAGEIIKRAYKHSTKEVAEALVAVQNNLPTFMIEIIEATED